MRTRHDGWTPERRARFLEALALTGCVRDGCRAVRLSSTSAYRTRALLPDFAAAWEEALATARVGLEAAAYNRAVQGVEEPIVRGGEVIATRRKYSDGLLALLLKRGDMKDEKEAARIEAESGPLPFDHARHMREEALYQDAISAWLKVMTLWISFRMNGYEAGVFQHPPRPGQTPPWADLEAEAHEAKGAVDNVKKKLTMVRARLEAEGPLCEVPEVWGGPEPGTDWDSLHRAVLDAEPRTGH